MKRTMPWSDEDTSSDDESSTPNSDTEDNLGFSTKSSKHNKSSQAVSAKRKGKGVDFEALSRHGYKGGLSVLKVHHPRNQIKNRIGLGQVARKLGKKRRKKHTRIASRQDLHFWKQNNSFTHKLRKRRTFLSHRRKRGREILVRLAEGRAMLKRKRGC